MGETLNGHQTSVTKAINARFDFSLNQRERIFLVHQFCFYSSIGFQRLKSTGPLFTVLLIHWDTLTPIMKVINTWDDVSHGQRVCTLVSYQNGPDPFELCLPQKIANWFRKELLIEIFNFAFVCLHWIILGWNSLGRTSVRHQSDQSQKWCKLQTGSTSLYTGNSLSSYMQTG